MFVKRNKIPKEGQEDVILSYIVKSVRKDGKPRHKILANISHLPDHAIETIRQALKGVRMLPASEEFEVEASFDFGDLGVLRSWAKRSGLYPTLHSHLLREDADRILAAVYHRILAPGSKLDLYRNWLPGKALPTLQGRKLKDYKPNLLYGSMDKLLSHKREIEEDLFGRREKDPHHLLYDLTSIYFEGENCRLAEYGYSRDHRSDRPQVVLGLVCDQQGIPLTHSVHPGNTVDWKTIKGKLGKWKENFSAGGALVVGDRGMINSKNEAQFREEGIDYLLALKHRTVKKLIRERSKEIQLGLFDEKNILEAKLDGDRYIFCRNPAKAARSKKIRENILNLTEARLEEIQEMIERGSVKREKIIQEKVVKCLDRKGTEKYFQVEVGEGKLEYRRNQKNLKEASWLDGLYVLKTTAKREDMGPEEIRDAYKGLSQVEQGFKLFKNDFQIRPVYHYLPRRVRAHLFICFLALYLRRRIENNLGELSKQKSWKEIFSTLSRIRLQEIRFGEGSFYQLTELEEGQKEILHQLEVELNPQQVRSHGMK